MMMIMMMMMMMMTVMMMMMMTKKGAKFMIYFLTASARDKGGSRLAMRRPTLISLSAND